MSTATEPASAPVATGPITKVFVGNLAFRTTDQDIQNLFKECGEIKAGVIITRGRRSLGYGFIDFQKPEDAVKSVETMNKKDFGGRPLKVELAKDDFERADRFERTDRDEPEGGDYQQGEGKPKRNRPRRQQGEPGSAPAPASAAKSALVPVKSTNARVQPVKQALVPVQQGDDAGPALKRKRQRKRKNKGANSAGGAAPQTQQQGGAPSTEQTQKAPRQKPPPREKVMSTTTLFVANLPFSVDDDQLAALFKDCGAQSAHVVKTHSGRSRGYGFVVFENEKAQLNALEKKNGLSVDGTQTTPEGVKQQTRTIAISISSSVPPETQPPANPQ